MKYFRISIGMLTSLFFDIGEFVPAAGILDIETIQSVVKTVSMSLFILCIGVLIIMGWSINKLSSDQVTEEFN